VYLVRFSRSMRQTRKESLLYSQGLLLFPCIEKKAIVRIKKHENE
jgi:hypothetical protein